MGKAAGSASKDPPRRLQVVRGALRLGPETGRVADRLREIAIGGVCPASSTVRGIRIDPSYIGPIGFIVVQLNIRTSVPAVRQLKFYQKKFSCSE